MKIFVAGDYVPQNRIHKLIENNNFSFFDEIKNLTQEADFAIVNLEAPIYNNESKPIQKCGPNLKISPKVIESLKYGEFNVVTLANNHILDYGPTCLEQTEFLLDEAEIKHVGTGKNVKNAQRILYLEKNGQKVAVINCCEHEFSIADSDKPGANPLNPVHQYNAIQEAKDNADYILVIVHGGHEHWQLPSPRMVETYRFFIDAGADAVINHHQHCFSGYEVYKNKPIFYGIGNFCFDNNKSNRLWNEGYMVELDFDNEIKFKIHPYIQCAEESPKINFHNDDSFYAYINDLNNIIKDEQELQKKNDDYYKQSMKSMNSIIQPYNNRIFTKLNIIGLLPNIIRGAKLKKLENYILCESHRDRMEYFLKNNHNEH